MKEYKLFTAEKVGVTPLLNRVVMAPLTRCRAIGNIPNELMATYYEQRSGGSPARRGWKPRADRRSAPLTEQ